MLATQKISIFPDRQIAALSQGVTLFALEPDFDFRCGPYLRLFQNSGGTAFQHPLWLDAFYRLIAPARGAEKVVVTGRDAATGALRLVLPFIRHEADGLVVIETADLGVSDHAAPIAGRDWIMPASIRDDIAYALPDHDLLRVRPVRADTVERWRDFIDGDAHEVDFFGPATELTGPFPQWTSGAPDQGFRKPAERDGRRLRCGASELRLLTDSGEIAKAIEAIRASREGRFETDPIQDRPVCDFYTSVAVAGSVADFSRTYAVIRDGATVGHVFGIRWKHCFHYLLIGCDFEREGRFDGGLLLHDTMVEDWLQDDGSVFDFTIGDEAFKNSPSNLGTAGMFVVTRAPTWRGRLARAALDARDDIERMQRGTLAA